MTAQLTATPRNATAGEGVPSLLTLEDVATRLVASRRWVEDLIKRGRLSAVRMGPKMVRVRASDFTRYVDGLPPVRGSAA